MRHALVLLHGFTGSPASWRPVLDLLPPETRRLAPALLGHAGPAEGSAAAPAHRHVRSFVDEVDRIADFAAQLNGPRHIAGYSLGARVALGLLVRHPGVFDRATLIGVNPGIGDAAERAERARSDRRWIDLLEQEGLDAFLTAWRAQPMWASQDALPGARRAEQERIGRSHDPAGLALSLRALGLAAMPDWTEALPSIDVPVTLMTGELDTKFGAIADAMAARLPRARRLTVAAAGHNLLLERPDAVADVLNPEDER